MIRIPWIRIRHTGVADPYVFAGAGFKLFSSDSGSGSKKGPVRNQIKSRILYPYPNFKVSNLPDSNKTPLFYLRLRSENLNKVPVEVPVLIKNNCSNKKGGGRGIGAREYKSSLVISNKFSDLNLR